MKTKGRLTSKTGVGTAVNIASGTAIGYGISTASSANMAVEYEVGILTMNKDPQFLHMGKRVRYLAFQTAQQYSLKIDSTLPGVVFSKVGDSYTKVIPMTNDRKDYYFTLVANQLGFDATPYMNYDINDVMAAMKVKMA